MSLLSIPFRGFISVKGNDKILFLNNLVTQNLLDIRPGEGVYTLLLSPKGRYESDFFVIYYNQDEIILDAPKSHISYLISRFNFFKMRRSLQILDVTTRWRSLISLENKIQLKLPDHSLSFNDSRFINSRRRILCPIRDLALIECVENAGKHLH